MKVIRWFIINILVFALVAGAAYSMHPGLVRCAKLFLISWTAFSAVLLVLCALAFIASCIPDCDLSKFPKETKLRAVPAWVSHVFDFSIVMICAYSGWMWTAAIYLSHVFFQCLSISLLEAGFANRKKRLPANS
jgi:hypothetical protein